MTLEELKAMKAEGRLHHATYRYEIAPGWHIYEKDPQGFRGYRYRGYFSEARTDRSTMAEVKAVLRGTGYSVGSYGNG